MRGESLQTLMQLARRRSACKSSLSARSGNRLGGVRNSLLEPLAAAPIFSTFATACISPNLKDFRFILT